MKIFKRILVAVLCVILTLSVAPISDLGLYANAATNGKTQAEAIGYMNDLLGTTVGSGQCPALAQAYYAYLGYSVSGNGKDYYYNVPNGWTRIEYTSGVVAQPGDVAVWKATTSELGAIYGHVAIVESGTSSGMTIYEQGNSFYNKVVKNTITYGQYGQLTCFIRPDFENYTSIPNPVLNLHSERKVYNSSEYINFNWESAYGAQGYWLHMWKDGAEIYSCNSNSTSFTSAPTSPGRYTLCIRPYNDLGINEHSKSYDFIVTDSVPNPVTNLRSEKTVYSSSEYINFEWDEAYGAQNYWVYLWKDGQALYSYNCGINTSFTSAPTSEGQYTLCIRPGNVNGFNEDSKSYSFIVNDGYAVKYNANGGNGAPSAQTKTYGTTLTLSTTKPTRTGYTFTGWNTKADGSGTSYAAGASYTANAAVTLYAQWTANPYTVTFNSNGGTCSTTSKSVTYASTYGTLPTPTRTGYTFNGWYTALSGGTKITSDTIVAITSAQTLYAHWTANSYSVTFDANGGSGAPAAQTKTYGEALTLSSTKPTRSGYTFLGWSTSSTATSAQYSAGGTYTANSAVTLYAVWQKNAATTYTLSYNANGGSGAPSSQTGAVSYTVSSTQPTRSGYTFLGWSKSSSATSASYTAGNSITLTANTTLYAVWQKNAVEPTPDEPTPTPTPTELPEIKINRTSTTAINYGDTLVLTLDEIEIPEGYAIEWFVEGAGVSTKVNADGTECRVTSIANGNATITAKLVDENGEAVTNEDNEEISDEIAITSKAGFFQKFISFFKNLFGANRIIY